MTYVTNDQYGSRTFNVCALARDIAAHLDGYTVECEGEGSSYSNATLRGFDGALCVTMRNGYGAKFGKIEFNAYFPAERNLEHYQRAKLDGITLDGSRPVEKLAADLKRRLLDLAPAALEHVTARVAEKQAALDALAAKIAELSAAFPGLSFNRRDANSLSADVYFNRSGRYLTGSIDVDGRLNVQRLSLNTADDAKALFTLIAREG